MDYLDGTNIITRLLQDGRGRQKRRAERCDGGGLNLLLLALKEEEGEHRSRMQVVLEVEKGEGTLFPEPPERSTALLTLRF